jgi:two-component system chemotaxis sensor kinase CheA
MSNGNNNDFPYNNQTSMLGDSDLQNELLAAFKSELDEYLQVLNVSLLKIEQGESSDQLIQEIFRTAHSMKGTSGAFGLTKIQKISHALENLFGAVRSKRFVMDKLAFDVCYEGLDMISKLMEMELAGAETPVNVEVNFAQSVEILLNSASIGSTDPNLRQKTVIDQPAPDVEALGLAPTNQPFIVGQVLSNDDLEVDTAAGSKLKASVPKNNPFVVGQVTDDADLEIDTAAGSKLAEYYNPPAPKPIEMQVANPYTPSYEPISASISTASTGGTAIFSDNDLQGELLAAFKSELDEYLQVLNVGLLKMEQGESSDQLIQEIFRTAHSMKGTSGAFGLTKIQKISHALENLFGVVRSKRFNMDKISFDVCYDGLDLINKLMELELSGMETPANIEVEFAARIEELLSSNTPPAPTPVVSSSVPNRPAMPPSAPAAQVAPSPVPNRPVMPPPSAPPAQVVPSPVPNRPVMPPPSAPAAQVAPSPVPNRPVMPPPSAPPAQVAPNPVPNRPVMPPPNALPSAPPAQAPVASLAQGPMLTKDLHRELLDSFRSELDEYLEVLNNKLLKLEQNISDDTLLREIFRKAHSMKGAAGALGLIKIQNISHNLETLFGEVRSGNFTLDRQAFDLCYEGLDTINKLMNMVLAGTDSKSNLDQEFIRKLDNLLQRKSDNFSDPSLAALAKPSLAEPLPQSPQKISSPPVTPVTPVAPVTSQSLQKTEPAKVTKPEDAIPATITPSPVPQVQPTNNQPKTEFIRIPLVKIDHLMSDVGELIITRSRYEQRVKELENINTELFSVLKEMLRVRPIRRKIGKIEGVNAPHIEKLFGNLEFCETKLKSINSLLQNHTEDFSNDDLHLELIVSSIQREVQGLRMLPIETLFEPLRRRVRDISRQQDKSVTLELLGGETELDRQLIEAMRDPLVHLITNSIDHGLETPDQRKESGKNPTGKLKLSAGQRGNQIIIEISDDGRGIDFEKVKQKAISVGMFTERELASFTEDEIVALIFKPGFSTKQAVTEFSGRGVGLDVVKVNVEKLQGQIEINTGRGKGSTFRITLPLTLSTQRVLLIKVASQLFALPVNAIDRLMSISVEDVFTVGARMAISIEGKPISLLHLNSLLNVAENEPEAKQEHVVMVLAMGNERTAFVIDEALGEQEVVVKALGKPLRKMKNIAGGAILGDGSVMLLLNPSDLLRTGKGVSKLDTRFINTQQEKNKVKSKVLVIDDSITTRTLEKNILEMAGYEVLLAKDGLEGLEMSKTPGCNLVLADIQMPGLSGLELTQEIKRDPKTKHLPVVLISSLDSPEVKAKVAQAGADAFIVKGQFDQSQFLEVVKSMIVA